MITHLHAATIVVSDQDKAIDFYVNVLGWEVTMDSPMGPSMRWVTIAPKEAATSIALSVPAWHTENSSLQMGKNTGIAFACEDIKSTYDTLVKRGVEFKSPPEMMPWGKLGVWFFDPDRNEFFMAES